MKSSMKESNQSHDYSETLMRSTFQSDNLKVVIRVRPPLTRELEEDLPFRSIVF
jgi:hypothetical protein